MSNVLFRVDGKDVGICEHVNFKEASRSNYYRSNTSGEVRRIRFKSQNLLVTFITTISANVPLQFEFEFGDYIFKVSRARVSNYNYSDGYNGAANIMNEMRFECESFECIPKNKVVAETKPLINNSDILSQEMINKFTAAVSNYYKKDK